jgi:hypothetical protein
MSTIGLKPDLTSTLHALQVAQHVLEMFRRTLSDTSGSASPVVDRLANRLTKIAAALRNSPPHKKQAEIGRVSRQVFTNNPAPLNLRLPKTRSAQK